jgi:hypothetical protein
MVDIIAIGRESKDQKMKMPSYFSTTDACMIINILFNMYNTIVIPIILSCDIQSYMFFREKS